MNRTMLGLRALVLMLPRGGLAHVGNLFVDSDCDGKAGVYNAANGSAVNANLVRFNFGSFDIALDRDGHLFVASYDTGIVGIAAELPALRS